MSDPTKHPITLQGALWLREMPAPLQELARKFPPACVVRATWDIGIRLPRHRRLRKGETAMVVSYQEGDGARFPGGVVWVAKSADTPLEECTPARPDQLEVVEYAAGMDPLAVASVLVTGES